jgi:hypothetical protein
MESLVEKALARLLEEARPFEYATVAAIAKPERPPIPEIRIAGPDLTIYDRLLTGTSS